MIRTVHWPDKCTVDEKSLSESEWKEYWLRVPQKDLSEFYDAGSNRQTLVRQTLKLFTLMLLLRFKSCIIFGL